MSYSCPQCQTKGDSSVLNQDLNCSSCQTTYPKLGGIPFLISNPNTVLSYWKTEKAKLIEKTKSEANSTKQQSELEGILPMTQKRLRKFSQAKFEQANFFQKILGPLDQIDTNNAYSPEAPFKSQDYNIYLDNIHRDWSWGEVENKQAIEAIKKFLPNDNIDSPVILGSGAGRLAYDFLAETKPENSYLIDINPLLHLSAHSLFNGEKLKLYDFPIAPMDLKSSQTLSKISCPTKEKITNVEFLFGDAQNIPLQKESTNLVITPWLIDILDGDPEKLIREINRILKTNGAWINYGPLGFTHQEQRFHFTIEEIKEALEVCGFEIEICEQEKTPYMQNPASQHSRVENLFIFKAKKIKGCERKKDIPFLPEWLINTRVPVPRTPHFENLIATFNISSKVFEKVNNANSLEQIAKDLSPEFGMSQEETLQSLKRFFKRHI